MNNDLISANLSENNNQVIMEAIQTIRKNLPFSIDLSGKERQNVLKLGDKSRAFVDKALNVATQNSDLLPRSFDLKESQSDVKLFSDLNGILIALSQLNELIDDTVLAAGCDSYGAALKVYAYVKVAGTGEGLDELKAMMSKRFVNNGKLKDKPVEFAA